ncbi:hypothetical protein WME94_28280 [Sorangium sp. So ce429]
METSRRQGREPPVSGRHDAAFGTVLKISDAPHPTTIIERLVGDVRNKILAEEALPPRRKAAEIGGW